MPSKINKDFLNDAIAKYVIAIAKFSKGYIDPTNEDVCIKYIKVFDLDIQDNEKVVSEYNQPIYAPIEYPYPNLQIEIIALTSLIQPATCACFINSSFELLKTSIDLQIEYYDHDNESLLNKLKYYNQINQPIIVSVTEGLEKILSEDKSFKCYKALESIPGYLRLTSPKANVGKDVKNIDPGELSIYKLSHPTDDIAIDNFIRQLHASKLNEDKISEIINQSIIQIQHFPENPEVYKKMSNFGFGLTQDYVDLLAGMKSRIDNWEFLERRYIYFNQSLIEQKYSPKNLLTKKELSFAKWCQRYLASQFWDTINGKSESWQNIIKNSEYLKLINDYFKH